MSTPPSTPVSVDLESIKPKKGMSMDNIIKIIGIVVVIYIIYAVFSIFRGIKNDPAYQSLKELFNNTTAALAWASGHWELLLAAYLIAPMVPQAFKWAADKMAAVEKKGVEPKVKEKIVDMINFKVKSDMETTGTTEKERADAKASADASAENFERGQEEEDKKAREEAERVAADPKVDIPKIPERALQQARALLQARAFELARATGAVRYPNYART